MMGADRQIASDYLRQQTVSASVANPSTVMSDCAVSAVVLALLLLLVTAGTAGAFGQSGTEQVDVETDSTQLTVDVQSDGNATWAVTYRISLDDETDTEAFESLRQDVQNDSTPYTDRFGDRMRRIAATAENETNREMAIRNVTVETRTQVDTGLLVYRFEWTNFAAVDGDTVRAGDAIDQFYLDSTTSLRIRWPEGYERSSSDPPPTSTEDGEITWQGQLSFDPGEPRVVVVPEGETPTGTTQQQGGGTNTDGTTTPAGDAGSGGLPTALLLVLAVLVVGAAALLYTRREALVGDDESEGESAGGDGDDGDDAAGPPPELLSNEERVLRLLEENGGRMKQKKVAEQLDWTAAKTSQVVGDLRDDDELESFRLGRENVLTLPDVDLEASDDADEES